MHNTKTTILAVLLALLCAPPAYAGEFCLHAHQGEPASSGSATPLVVSTSTGPYAVARFANSGNVYLTWNATVPPDMPDAMEWTGVSVHWMKGTSTTGVACWHVLSKVIKDGQDYGSVLLPLGQWVVENAAIPTGDNVKLSSAAWGADGGLYDAAGGGSTCVGEAADCRLAPLRVHLKRHNTGNCGSGTNSDGAVDFVKLCFTY